MNIDAINKQSANPALDVEKTKYSNHSYLDSRMKTNGMGYSLDISGKVMENAAYGKEELKSVQDIAQKAKSTDVTLERNYMAVMSNSMSDEDFAQLMEDGVNPTKTSVEESVTSLDKIKIKMAEAGVTITGFNDNLSPEDYEAVTGSEGVVKAVETAKNLDPLSDETVIYMLQNEMPPTIENIYKAENSVAALGDNISTVRFDGAATYASANETDLYWDDIKSQAELIVDEAGIDSETGMDAAKHLIEKQVPLNETTLDQYITLSNMEIPNEEKDILKYIDNAIVEGKSPMEADFSKDENIYEEAVRIKKEFDEIDLGQDVSARRQLEEVRLAMTSEANLMLLRKGISIDTSDLENLVEQLKEAEREFYRPVLEDNNLDVANNSDDNKGIASSSNADLDAKIELYKSSIAVIKEIPTLPAEAVVSALNSKDESGAYDFNLEDIHNEGTLLRQNYENASRTYEALMTAPRGDLGDSISKAFSNVDDILTDEGLPLNDANRKAVRTLGYANMPIDKESIENIREVTMTVSRVVSMLTPSKTLELIREGHNPLNDNIYDLEKELSSETVEESSEKYSKFLVELERKGEITQEEKSAYIGMYRLLNVIEKQDGRVIGNVLSTGQDLTMQNMLAASRSNRHKNMDIKIDDEFGLLEDLVIKDESITEQISKGFTEMLSAPLSRDYVKEEMENIKKAAKADEEVSAILSAISEPVSVSNILALEEMMSSFDKGTKKLFGSEDKRDDTTDNRADDILTGEDATELIDGFNSKEEAADHYDEYIKKALETSERRISQAQESIDVREWALVHKQLGFASSMGKEDVYEIPVKTEDGYTSIHLTVKHGENANGRVTASMETAEYGKLSARFTLGREGVDGFIVSDSRYGLDNVKSKKSDIISELEKEGIATKDISFAFGNTNKLNEYDFGNSSNDNVTDGSLYKVAKAFVIAIGQ